MATHTAMAQGSDAFMRSELEQHLGIMHFVSTKKHGWFGQSRTRWVQVATSRRAEYQYIRSLLIYEPCLPFSTPLLMKC